MFGYRQRILGYATQLLGGRGGGLAALDFGSGDGWFAWQFTARGLAREVTGIDVRCDPRCRLKPIVYSGGRLPFADGAFDLVYSIDVLHHCDDPVFSLTELMRCTKRYLLIKDHVYGSWTGYAMLCAMDEIGNRLAGVPSPYHYQRNWSWRPVIEAEDFIPEGIVHPARCHPLMPSFVSDGLQFVGLWRRHRAVTGGVSQQQP